MTETTLARSREAARECGFAELRHVRETGSTNDDLAAEARAGETGRAVLVADHQRVGRGRLQRQWLDAGDSSLLVSFRFPSGIASAGGCMAAVSAAALDACRAALGAEGASVLTKWPNDLVVEHARVSGKLAGLLAELVAGEPAAVIVGLGLNIKAVPEVPGAVSLRELGGRTGRDELLAGIITRLRPYLDEPDRALAAVKAASSTLGRAVRVNRIGAADIDGVATGIDSEGRLVVVAGDVEHRIETGDVIHLRPA